MATQQTTAVERYRRLRGQHPRPRRDVDEKTAEQLPEYLEAHEVGALIRAAPNPRARLLFLVEWRAGHSACSSFSSQWLLRYEFLDPC